jgi:ribosomal protein S18 acetylase RimI-like enzyme
MSFMFTYDDPPHEDREVAYLYEIHLLEQLRGRGLGKKLVEFLEMAARQTGISKTMLTVFASNSAARGLYENLGYGKDACSPGDRVIRRRVIKADYIIMSKELV